jgi:parallel beta-helix repeat protein
LRAPSMVMRSTTGTVRMSRWLLRYKAIPLGARRPSRPPAPMASRLPPSRLATALSTILVVLLPVLLILPLMTADAAGGQLTVSPETAAPGARVTVSGVAFTPALQGTLALDGSIGLGRFSTTKQGSFSTRVTLPRDAASGTHTIVALAARGQLDGATVLASVMISVATAAVPTATAVATPAPAASPTAIPPSATPTATVPVATPVASPTATPGGPSSTPSPAPPAGGLYVAPTGSDANPGSLAAPWRTPAHAATVAPAGTTIFLRTGTYAGFDVTRSGLTFSSYPGEVATVSDAARDNVIEFSGVTSGALRGLIVQGSSIQYGSGVKIKDSSGVTISGSTIRNNRTWGIVVVRSTSVRIEDNTVTGNANGIEERYAADLVIARNRIHGNVTMVDSGRGRQGINFYKSTGAVTVTGNLLWDNGTHFEVYGASNLNITGNVTWNGQVMETGTDGPACDGNRFTRNVGYRGAGFDGSANGLILRCASNMLVAHNTLDGFDQFALDIVDGTSGVAYGGSIANLRILNNVLSGGRAYSIDSALPSTVQIDYNLLYNTGSTAVYADHLAYVAGIGNLDTLDAFTVRTGYDSHGRFGDPRFVNRAAGDYHVSAGSPAVDAGTEILGDGHNGTAPDVGRFELP